MQSNLQVVVASTDAIKAQNNVLLQKMQSLDKEYASLQEQLQKQSSLLATEVKRN